MPLFQMSATRVPNEERVLPEADQIAVGSVANNEEEALPTVVLVLVLMSAVAPVTADPRDEEAVPTMLLVLLLTAVVPAVIAEAIDEDAVVTSD